MKKQKKSRYGLLPNILWMIRVAWTTRKSVLGICLLLIALEIGVSVAQLLLAPVILSKVENAAPLFELLVSITVFSLMLTALFALRSYVSENKLIGRIGIRKEIINMISVKAGTTSFPNMQDPEFLRLWAAADDAVGGNQQPTEKIWTTLTELGTAIAGFVIYLAMLSELDPVLIAVTILTTAVGFFFTRHMNDWGFRHRDEMTRFRKGFRYSRDKATSVTMAKDIRIFGLQEWLGEIFEGARALSMRFIERQQKACLIAGLLDVLLAFLRNGIAYAYLIHRVIENGGSASQFLLYFGAISGFTVWVTSILEEVSELQKQNLGLSMVREFLDYEERFCFEGGMPIPQAERYELRLENVSFRYPGADRDVIHRMDLTIHPGERLAVVGLNGAGKTTLVSLLCGFYDPDEGRVLLNGTDIRSFNRQEYYALFSAVFQRCSVFDVTVAETVAQCPHGLDMERVKRCVDRAGLAQDMAKLPQGFDTHIGRKAYLDGVLLSGGQMQRLMLARALYKDGPILLLDEPTAALDPLAEHDIYMKYSEMTKGKTSVFISHRLASTRFCDRILFLEDGAIIEEGTHDALLALGGKYAALFEVQSRYYQEGRDFRDEEQ